MAAKKRTCKNGRTKDGKCRKSRKSSRGGLSDFVQDYMAEIETLKNVKNLATKYDRASACSGAVNTLISFGQKVGSNRSAESELFRAKRIFHKYCDCTGK